MWFVSAFMYHGMSFFFVCFFFLLKRPWSKLLYNSRARFLFNLSETGSSMCFENPFNFVTCDLEIKGSHWGHFPKLVLVFLKFLALGTHQSAQHPFLRLSFVLFAVKDRRRYIHQLGFLTPTPNSPLCASQHYWLMKCRYGGLSALTWTCIDPIAIALSPATAEWADERAPCHWAPEGWVGVGVRVRARGGAGDSLPDLRRWRGHRPTLTAP